MRNSILKCRDITADKSPYHQNYVRHHIKTWELDHKEYWPLKRLFFWPANRSKQLILKGINPEYSLEGLMLKLKFQCIGYLMQSNDSLENILRLRKIEGRRRRGWYKMRWLDSIIDSMDMSPRKLWEIVKDRKARWAAVHGVTKRQTQVINWIAIVEFKIFSFIYLIPSYLKVSYMILSFPYLKELKISFNYPKINYLSVSYLTMALIIPPHIHIPNLPI